MDRQPHIVVLNGSPRAAASQTRVVCDAIADALQTHGARVTAWHLAEREVPRYPGPLNEDLIPSEAQAFIDTIADADAVIFATPTYHGSFSGRTKDAIDWVSSKQLGGKVAGLCCHAGGIRTTTPISALREITRSVGMINSPCELATESNDIRDSETGELVIANPHMHERIDRFAHEMISLTMAICPQNAAQPV